MSEEDTLLDAFVKIDVKGQGESKEAIDQFLIAAKKAFGDAGQAQAIASIKGADAQAKAIERTRQSLFKFQQEQAAAANKAAADKQKSAEKGADAEAKALARTSQHLQKYMQEQAAAANKAAADKQKAAEKGADAEAKALARTSQSLFKFQQEQAVAANKAAAKSVVSVPANNLRSELLKFSDQKNEVSVGVRLLGNADIERQFQDIQARVTAASARFRDAPSGKDGNDVRAAELATITSLREKDLAVINQQVQAELKAKGLDAVYATRAEALSNATEQVQRFTLALQEVNSVVSKSKSPDLKNDLLIASNAAKEIKQTLSSSLASGDLVGAQKAIAGLNEVEKRLKAIGAKASQQVNINTNVKDLVSQFNVAVQKAQSLSQLLQFESAGKLNIEQKLGLAKVEKEVRDIVNEFRNLSKATKITQADFKRLQILATNFSEATESMNAMQRSVTNVSKSTNQLGNNAYQLGQAFEDAAVGFSLNGIQGAFRGAANNISFLINNLAQAGTLTKVLGASTAALLPLYVGIGTAALFVLPVLYDWWKSLDDVENKLKDISELMKREFEDIELKLSIIFDAEDRAKILRDAKSVADVIEEVIKTAEKDGKLSATITATINELAFTQGMTRLSTNLGSIMEELERQTKIVFRLDFVEKSAEAARALDVFKAFEDSLDKLQEKSKDGLVDKEAFSNAKDKAQNMLDVYKELIASGLLSEEEFGKAENGIIQINALLKELDASAQKISDGDLFAGAFEAGVTNAEKLTRELQFQQAINAGIATEEDRILFKMKEELLATEKLNDELLKKNANSAEANKLAEQNTAETKLKHEIELLKRIHEIEKELAERQNKNNSARQSELGDRGVIVHGDLAKDKELQAIEDLTEELRKLREALAEIQGIHGFVGPIDPRTQEEKDAFNFVGPIDTRDEDEKEKRKFERRQKEFVEQRRKEQADFDARITNETIATDAAKAALDAKIKAEEEAAKIRADAAKEEIRAAEEAEKIRADAAKEEEKRIREQAFDERNAIIALMPQVTPEQIAAKKAELEQLQKDADLQLKKYMEEQKLLKEQAERDRQAAKEQERFEQEMDKASRPERQRQEIKELTDQIVAKNDEIQSLKDQLFARGFTDKQLNPATATGIFSYEDTVFLQNALELIKALERDRRYIIFKRDELEGVLLPERPFVGPQQPSVQSSFAPEDIPAQVNAQAQANARAMENTNFTSTTLQTLIATSNEILGKLNENVSKLDVSSRFT